RHRADRRTCRALTGIRGVAKAPALPRADERRIRSPSPARALVRARAHGVAQGSVAAARASARQSASNSTSFPDAATCVAKRRRFSWPSLAQNITQLVF